MPFYGTAVEPLELTQVPMHIWKPQWYLFAFVFLIGAPYTLSQNRHVRVDVLYGRFSVRTQSIINLIGHVLLLPFVFFEFGPLTNLRWILGPFGRCRQMQVVCQGIL